MKTTIKILILIAGIAACVGGVMYYAKTKVAPPEVPATCNQYRQHLNQLLSAFSTTNTTTTNDSILSAAVVATNIFHREGKLTAPEADTFLVSFVNAYTPLFRQQAQSQFKQSAWPAQNIQHLSEQIAMLRRIRLTDGTSSALTRTAVNDLEQISRTIALYNEANSLCHNVYFSTIAQARRDIGRANTLMNDPWLSHNIALKNSLDSVRSQIHQKHIAYLKRRVEELANYSQYSDYYYENTLTPEVQKTLDEYDDNAESLYGLKKEEDISNLLDRAIDLYKKWAERRTGQKGPIGN